jgi:hypothetical protein
MTKRKKKAEGEFLSELAGAKIDTPQQASEKLGLEYDANHYQKNNVEVFAEILDSAPQFPVFSEKDDVNRVIQVKFIPAYNQFLVKLQRFKNCLS